MLRSKINSIPSVPDSGCALAIAIQVTLSKNSRDLCLNSVPARIGRIFSGRCFLLFIIQDELFEYLCLQEKNYIYFNAEMEL